MSALHSIERSVVYRTKGHRHGFITRLMSPGDLGEVLKPFVFLDYFESDGAPVEGIPAHPHSGIATHTTLLEGQVRYGDSTGKAGILQQGSVEWMQAGGGVWHWGKPEPGVAIRGYQLWVALPPKLELASAESAYVDARAIERDANVRVLLGSYGQRESPVRAPSPITYLHVSLEDGERWKYRMPKGHELAWIATHRGAVEIGETTLRGELAVLDPRRDELSFTARGDTELVLGSATRHPYPLVTGYYSVHTSDEARAAGEAGIRRVDRSDRGLSNRATNARPEGATR
jgi:redox-sensitive bicupin YhaK (pirin superfamily)